MKILLDWFLGCVYVDYSGWPYNGVFLMQSPILTEVIDRTPIVFVSSRIAVLVSIMLYLNVS